MKLFERLVLRGAMRYGSGCIKAMFLWIHQKYGQCVQKAETLYRTRSVRFRSDNKDNFISMMGLKDGMSILEVGCGPGLLCHRLAEWLPNSKITGLDRDENFILFAKNKATSLGLSCTFIQGDALSLPFANNGF